MTIGYHSGAAEVREYMTQRAKRRRTHKGGSITLTHEASSRAPLG
jgi:hypothetical protein